MSLEDKIASAKPTTFLTDGLSEEEVKQSVDEGRKRTDTVKLIIEIPKDIYDGLINNRGVVIPSYWHEYVADLCKNGTPLPKGHGRLIDADYLRNVALLHNFHGNNKSIVPYSDRKGYRLRQREVDEAIINAPTIIEADEAEREDFPQAKDIEPTVKGFVDTMDILDRICEESEDKE